MKISNKKYTIYTLISVVTLALALFLFLIYKLQTYDGNRVSNVRAVPKEYRASLIDLFINKKLSLEESNGILILGDSQPNGHAHPTKYTFAYILEKKIKKPVINIAFQDARILDNIYALKYIKSKNIKFDKVVFNANASHVKEASFQRLETSRSRESYLQGFFKEPKAFLKLALNPNPIKKPPEKLILKKYVNYFKIDETSLFVYNNHLDELISIAKEVSGNVVIYITPHSLNAVKYNDARDLESLEIFAEEIEKNCLKNKVFCLQPKLIEDKYYFDIVHFNKFGHIKFAEVLNDFLLRIDGSKTSFQ